MTKETILEQLKQLERMPVNYAAGMGTYAKDLSKVLYEGEIIIACINGYKKGVGHFIKGGKIIRSYLVLTNERVILIERGIFIAHLIKPLNKTLIIPRNSIIDINEQDIPKGYKVFYDKQINIRTPEKLYEFFVVGDFMSYISDQSNEKAVEMSNLESGETEKKFCIKCGREIPGNSNVCPYCGARLREGETGEEIGSIGNSSASKIGKRNEKKSKKKAILGIAAVVAVAVIGVITVSMGGDKEEKEASLDISKEEPISLEEAGGFEQWKENGFKQNVRTDIVFNLPISKSDRNNYAVTIGAFQTDVIVIMQEDESPMKEWEWLSDADETGNGRESISYKATLSYTGVETDTEEKLPVFIVSDVEPYEYSMPEEDEEMEEITIPVTVVNNTGIDIYEFYASLSETSDWEEDILGTDILLAGESLTINFTFDSEQTIWDFAIRDLNGDSLEFYDMDFSDCSIDGAVLLLEYDGENGYATLE